MAYTAESKEFGTAPGPLNIQSVRTSGYGRLPDRVFRVPEPDRWQ